MADNLIKTLKSNTFEELRQHQNEIAANLGADDRLDDARLTDRILSHADVTGFKRSVIVQEGASDTVKFEQIADTYIDNTAGTIVLTNGSTIPYVADDVITQGSGPNYDYEATVESVHVIENKRKIIVKNSTGSFDPTANLSNGTTTISASDILRLVSEKYNKGAVRVKVNGVEFGQGLLRGQFHCPTVAGRINLNNPNTTTVNILTNGTLIYQAGSAQSDEASVTSNATFYAYVYHGNDNACYIKSFGGTGSFNAGAQLRVLGSDTTIAASYLTSITVFPNGVGTAVEFNQKLSDQANVQIISTDLVTAINEVQDDIGEIADLQTTDTTDVVSAINELEEAARGTSLANYTLGTDSTDGLVGGVNELENIIRDASSEVANYAIKTNAHNIIAAIDELEEAARGTSLANYTLSTNSADGLVGGVNELEVAIRGTNNNLVSAILSTEATNLAAAINELDDQIGTADNTAAIAFSGGPAAAAGNTNLLDGINTIDAKIGQIDITDVASGESTITGAIAKLHDELGDVNISSIDTDTTTVTGALVQLHDEVGNTTALTTTATNLAAAINEHDTDIGALAWTGTGTTLAAANPSSVTSALNALDAELGDTDSYNDGYYGHSTVAGTLDLLQAGTISNDTEIHNMMELLDGERPGRIFLTDNTSIPADFAVGATLQQLNGASVIFSGTIESKDNSGALRSILVKDMTGTFDASKDLEIKDETDTISNSNVSRIAEVDATVTLTGLAATNIKAAIEEISGTTISAGAGLTGGGNLRSNKTINVIGGDGITANANDIAVDSTVIRTTTTDGLTETAIQNGGQTFTQNINFNQGTDDNGDAVGTKFTFGTNTVLDLTSATLQLGGGQSDVSFDAGFLVLNPGTGQNANQEGLKVDRGQYGGGTSSYSNVPNNNVDVAIQWNETKATAADAHRAWELITIKQNSDQTDWEADNRDIVTFGNAVDLVKDNSESGISVTWDDVNENFDFNVNDPVITISGAVAGNATMTNLGDTTISVLQQNNSVTLGTHTTGNYMSGISGTTNEIEVTHTASEGSSATVGLPNNVTITNDLTVSGTTGSTSTTTGALTVAGGVGITENVFIGGDLDVAGDFNTVTSNEVNIGDNHLVLNADLANNAGPTEAESGIIVNRGSKMNAEFMFDESNNRWRVLNPVSDGASDQSAGASLSNIITEADDFDSWSLGTTGGGHNSGQNVTISNSDTVRFREGKYIPADGSTTDNGIIELTRDQKDIYIEHKTFAGTSSVASSSDGTGVVSLTLDEGHVSSYETYDFDNRYMQNWTLHDGDGTQRSIIKQKEVKFIEGTGDGASINIDWTDTSNGTDGDPYDLTFSVTNSDKGSAQTFFKTFTTSNSDSGYTWTDNADVDVVADANQDTIKIVAGTDLIIAGDATSDAIKISHDATGAASNPSTSNSSGTFIKDIVVDDRGHLTAITSAAVPGQNSLSVNETTGLNWNYSDNSTGFGVNDYLELLSGQIPDADPQIRFDTSDTGIYFIHELPDGQTLGGAGNTAYEEEVKDKGVAMVGALRSDRTMRSGIIVSSAGNIYASERAHVFLVTSRDGSDTAMVSIDDDGNISVPANATVDGVDISALNTTVNGITSDTGVPAILGTGGNPTLNTGITAAEIKTLLAIDDDDTTYTLKNRAGVVADGDDVEAVIELKDSADTLSGVVKFEQNGLIGITRTGTDTAGVIKFSTTAEVNQNAFSNITVYDSTNTTAVPTPASDQSGTAPTTLAADNKTDTFSIHSDSGIDVRQSGSGDSIRIKVLEDQRGTISSFGDSTTNYMEYQSTRADLYFASSNEFRFESDGDFHADGNITAYSTTTTSDAKLKENVQVVDGALELVSQLDGVTFNWKKDGKASAGVIAQNVEEVLPSAVSEVEDLNGDDTHKVVDYNQLSALFIEAIKELKEENKQLRADIEALKNINNK